MYHQATYLPLHLQPDVPLNTKPSIPPPPKNIVKKILRGPTNEDDHFLRHGHDHI